MIPETSQATSMPRPHRDRQRLRRLRRDSRTKDVHLFRDAFLRLSRARDMARRVSELGASAEGMLVDSATQAGVPMAYRNIPTDLRDAATLLETLSAMMAEDIRVAEENLRDLLRNTDTPTA